MIKYTDAMTARRELGTLMDRAQYLEEYTIIKRANKPVAAIVSANYLERMSRYSDKLFDEIRKSGEEIGMSEEDAMELANAAKHESRYE